MDTRAGGERTNMNLHKRYDYISNYPRQICILRKCGKMNYFFDGAKMTNLLFASVKMLYKNEYQNFHTIR